MMSQVADMEKQGEQRSQNMYLQPAPQRPVRRLSAQAAAGGTGCNTESNSLGKNGMLTRSRRRRGRRRR